MLRLQWSGRLTLNEATIERDISDTSGVYRLVTRTKASSKYKVRYVGKAEKLKERLLQHLSPNEENLCIREKVSGGIKLWFRFAYCESKEDRENAEHTMYHHFGKPQCNQIEPSGELIEMNFG